MFARHPRLIGLLVACGLASGGGGVCAEEQNVYGWIALAPDVVVAEARRDEGKFTEVRVQRVIRGELIPDAELRVAVRRANRDRDRLLHRKALELTPGSSYLLLLEPAELGRKAAAKGPPAYDLVRGVQGARELPAEGGEALVRACERLVAIQDLKDDRLIWPEMAGLLEETSPILIEIALEQFLEFRRGRAELLPSVRPLLDHPRDSLREKAVRLIGQIVERADEVPAAEADLLRADVAARARRDEAVEVRIAATEALRGFERSAVVEILEEIAREDPDQGVRYAAAKLIHLSAQRAN